MWILDLELICTSLKEIKADILDTDFFVHALSSLPVEYEVQVSKLEECFGSMNNPLTIHDMCNELILKYLNLSAKPQNSWRPIRH